jgi:hypothetical protein
MTAGPVSVTWTCNADQATAQLDDLAAAAGRAAVIARAGEVLARAQERAWVTGGLRVVNAMALLEAALGDRDRDSLAVLTIEAATENLIITVRHACGGDEADYVGGDK